jgi:hypothetical protein
MPSNGRPLEEEGEDSYSAPPVGSIEETMKTCSLMHKEE